MSRIRHDNFSYLRYYITIYFVHVSSRIDRDEPLCSVRFSSFVVAEAPNGPAMHI